MGNIGTEDQKSSRREHAKAPRRKLTGLRIWNGLVRGFEWAVHAIVRSLRCLSAWFKEGMAIVRLLQPTLHALCIALGCVLVLGAALSIRPLMHMLSAKSVTLSDDNLTVKVRTRSNTVAELLMEYDIVLGEGDVVYPELSDPVGRGEEIMIRRAFSVSISADGQTHTVSLLNGTVGKALYLAGVSIDAQDLVTPALTESVTSGMEITVNRVDITNEVEQRRLHYYITYQDDDSLYIGTEEMVKQGKEGVKEVTMRVVTVDGVETERTVVSEEVIEPAQNRIVAKGTRPTPTPTPKPTPSPTPKKSASPTKAASATAKATATAKPKTTPDPAKTTASDVTDKTITVDGKTYTYAKTLSVTLTAYTHTGRKTSTGVWPSVGTVAVDKSVIPYGTKLYIPGYGFGVAQDTGVSGNHVDVFFDTEAECVKFGRKRDRTIYILE